MAELGLDPKTCDVKVNLLPAFSGPLRLLPRASLSPVHLSPKPLQYFLPPAQRPYLKLPSHDYTLPARLPALGQASLPNSTLCAATPAEALLE